jgi:hypothetical protein
LIPKLRGNGMSTSDELGPDDRQIGRIKYLLRVAGANAGLAGWTPQVIAILAPKLLDAMREEGYFIESWQHVADRVAELEPKP